KDLSAYSLTHAEILQQKEGVELLALGMLFGMSTMPAFRKNQERLPFLSEDAITYQGEAEKIEQEIAERKAQAKKQSDSSNPQRAHLQLGGGGTSREKSVKATIYPS
ncbi:MAG: hypothetical protein GY927_03075, partial [bacterium]|nr:hypothetical protein [bacterium]